jgi:hypothetical protein
MLFAQYDHSIDASCATTLAHEDTDDDCATSGGKWVPPEQFSELLQE